MSIEDARVVCAAPSWFGPSMGRGCITPGKSVPTWPEYQACGGDMDKWSNERADGRSVVTPEEIQKRGYRDYKEETKDIDWSKYNQALPPSRLTFEQLVRLLAILPAYAPNEYAPLRSLRADVMSALLKRVEESER